MSDGDTILKFVIKETVGQNRVTVTLDNHDSPFGAPRKHEIFALGGENERHLIRLDGRQTPIIHTRYTMWEPAVVKGHLRDHFTAGETTNDRGTGQEIVQKLSQSLENQRLCEITIGPWTWRVFPKKFRLPVEGLNDFTYELTFDVLIRPGYTAPRPPDDDGIFQFPFDITAEIQAILAADRIALVTQQIIVTSMVLLLASYAAVDNALSDTMAAAQAFENAPTNATAEARQMGSKAHQAKVQCDLLGAMLDSADPATVLTTTEAAGVASFQAQCYSASLNVAECKKRMRGLQYTANKRVRSTTTIYKVGPGDTLDSIATSQLGSAGRAGDLGLREQDLVSGKLIRIPA